MSTLTLSPAEARQIASMEQAIATAPFHQHYLTHVVYRPLTIDGLADRVQEAFGNGKLYDKRYSRAAGDYLVFLADQSIPSDLVRQALQTVGVDRIVNETISAESVLAAERHFQGQKWGFCPELWDIPQGCPVESVQAAHVAIVRGLLEIPGYRDQIGAELPELF